MANKKQINKYVKKKLLDLNIIILNYKFKQIIHLIFNKSI